MITIKIDKMHQYNHDNGHISLKFTGGIDLAGNNGLLVQLEGVIDILSIPPDIQEALSKLNSTK